MHAWSASDVNGVTLRALASLTDLLTHDISILDDAAVGLELRVGSEDVMPSMPHRVLFDERTFSTFLVYWGSGPELELSILLPVEGVPGVRDPLTGDRSGARGYTRDQTTGRVRATAPLTGRPMILDFNEGATDVVAERTGVTAERQLSVGEIIARHQQQQRAQDALVRNYTAHARMQQHFRPTVTDPGYDVSTENRYFVAGDDVEWEELSFSVNGSKWGADRPAFPLLQPEKVLSLPLQLRFDEGYRYRLEGAESVDEIDCYVVRFEPVHQREVALPRHGLDRQEDVRARACAGDPERALRAGGVERRDAALRAGPWSATVPSSSSAACRRARSCSSPAATCCSRRRSRSASSASTTWNSSGRAPRARESDRVMYRETDRGLRYYVKEGGVRVVSDRATIMRRRWRWA